MNASSCHLCLVCCLDEFSISCCLGQLSRGQAFTCLPSPSCCPSVRVQRMTLAGCSSTWALGSLRPPSRNAMWTFLVLRVLGEPCGVPAGCWILACSSAPARDSAALVLRPSPLSRLAPRSPRLGVFHGPTPRAISKLDILNHTQEAEKKVKGAANPTPLPTQRPE